MDELTCRYPSKRCDNLRAVKDDGELHRLCELHRQRANANQERWSRRQSEGKGPIYLRKAACPRQRRHVSHAERAHKTRRTTRRRSAPAEQQISVTSDSDSGSRSGFLLIDAQASPTSTQATTPLWMIGENDAGDLLGWIPEPNVAVDSEIEVEFEAFDALAALFAVDRAIEQKAEVVNMPAVSFDWNVATNSAVARTSCETERLLEDSWSTQRVGATSISFLV